MLRDNTQSKRGLGWREFWGHPLSPPTSNRKCSNTFSWFFVFLGGEVQILPQAYGVLPGCAAASDCPRPAGVRAEDCGHRERLRRDLRERSSNEQEGRPRLRGTSAY